MSVLGSTVQEPDNVHSNIHLEGEGGKTGAFRVLNPTLWTFKSIIRYAFFSSLYGYIQYCEIST